MEARRRYKKMSDDVKNDKLFKRAHEIVADAEERQHFGRETLPETVQRLAFRIAELEHAADKDEYTQT